MGQRSVAPRPRRAAGQPRQQPGSRGSTPTRRARKTLYPTFYFLRQAVRSRCWVCKSRASPAPLRPGISTGLPAIKSPRGQRGQRNSVVLYGSRPSGPQWASRWRVADSSSGQTSGRTAKIDTGPSPWPSPQPRPCRSQTRTRSAVWPRVLQGLRCLRQGGGRIPRYAGLVRGGLRVGVAGSDRREPRAAGCSAAARTLTYTHTYTLARSAPFLPRKCHTATVRQPAWRAGRWAALGAPAGCIS